MRDLSVIGASVATVVLLSVGSPSVGSAHIDPLAPLKSRASGNASAQKDSPCDGTTWGSGGSYTFEPGATITLGVSEYVPHPGYFRIAFDRDATASFKDPDSITSQTRPCKYNEFDRCDKDDFCTAYPADTGVRILWDNIDPHAGTELFKSWSWTIKLPDVECEKCTLQVIQVMEDTVHGPYCPAALCKDKEGSDYVEDIYHRCIDITLRKGATNSPTVATPRTDFKGVECPAPTDDATSSSSDLDAQEGGSDDGCSVSHGARNGALSALLLMALSALYLRRRKLV